MRVLCNEWGAHEARADRCDGNAVLTHVVAQTFQIADHGGLAGAIGFAAGKTADAADGTDAGKLAAAALAHRFDEGVKGCGHSKDVRAIDLFKNVQIFFVFRFDADRDAGVG